MLARVCAGAFRVGVSALYMVNLEAESQLFPVGYMWWEILWAGAAWRDRLPGYLLLRKISF